VTWLLFHVAEIDQEIGGGAPKAGAPQDHSEIVLHSISNVLHKMAGLDQEAIQATDACMDAEGSLTVEVALEGDATGYVAFVYPLAFVKNLIHTMMKYRPEGMGDLEVSALLEASNIIGGAICSQIAKTRGVLCWVATPRITGRLDSPPDERMAFDTGIGLMEADLVINYQ
jgi:chemotaxis protein CheY-P-specific phosphatase CheC